MLLVAGPRLRLRPPEPGDAARLYALGRDPAVTRWFAWGPYADPGQPEAWIAGAGERRERGEALELVVEDPEAGVLGVTGLLDLDRRDRRAVVGSWLGRPYWGAGRNREAKALVARLAFDTLGMERLTAYASTRNGRSQAALERVGFRREGVLAAWNRHGDVVHDVVVFGLVRAAWARGPLAGVDAQVLGEPPDPWVVAPAPAGI